MENVQTQGVPQQSAPQAVITPAPMESTTQYVAPQQMGMQPQSSPNKTLDFFKDINWFEVSFMFLGALALYKTIDYYSYKKKEEKTTYYDIQRQIDKLTQRATANEADTMQIIQMLEGNGSVMPVI